ncbi:MAG: response regulator [Bacteroidota bacterium]
MTNFTTARPFSDLTVLVVDDDQDMRLYLSGCLSVIGVSHVVEAADGREALQLARALVPDLIISDVVMPGIDGVALRRALKANSETAAIPFLLISGESIASADGADGFIAKPFNATRLRAEVDRLLG